MTAAPRATVLVVDDDRRLTGMLSELLETEGFACLTAPNGARGLLLLAEQQPDLVVLDVMMPGESGIETLKAMRSFSDVPVIMLTALGEDEDRIRGLETGADDYLPKPFAARELVLRIRAILKRAANRTDVGAGGGARTAGPLVVQLDKQRAEIGGVPLALTNTELRILAALVGKAGAVVSRGHLSRFAIGRELLPQDRTLDTHVSNIRRKLADSGDTRCAIRAVRGSGYRLTVD